MINLSYRPIRFETKDKIDFVYPQGLTLKEYLVKTGIDYSNCDIIVDGGVVTDLNIILKDESDVIITPNISGGLIVWAVGAISKLIATYGLFNVVVGAVTILSALYSIYSAITTKNNMPDFGSTGDGIDENSATYGWDGIRTTQEVGIPVKVIYGEHRSGGNIINQYISNDGDKQYLNILIACCEGEVESIDDILINSQPVANFEGVTTEVKLGTNDQTVIANFQDLHNVYPINVNLLQSDPYVYTTIESDVEGFKLSFSLNGLWQANPNTGVISAWSVSYKVEYKLHTDGSYTDLGIETISAKSRTTVRRIYSKLGLTAGQYDIRITRTSADSSLEPQLSGDLYLSSIDEIKTDDLAYPNTALLAIKALATDQLSGQTPNITFVAKGIKVSIPDILTEEDGDSVDWEDYYYDADTEEYKLLADDTVLYWDGTSYIKGYSANNIWCLRDIQTNTRYGLGEYIETENIDEDELLAMSQYCETKVSDGKGGYEKRFRLDVVLDSSVKAPDMISQICATFRAFSFYSNNGYSFRIDKVETPVQSFGMGNILKGKFQQSWKPKNEVYNMVEVQINDKENDYQNETITIIDEDSLANGDPIRKVSIRLFVANKSYAIREGRYALWVSKNINRSVSIGTGIDAIGCKSGDVVNVSHDVPQWGNSGRIISGSTDTIINLDQNVTIESGKTYKLMVRFANDTIEEKTIVTGIGTTNIVTVDSAFTSAPAAYDTYSFGESTTVKKPFRLINIARDKGGECSLALIEYNASVYDESGVVLPTNNYSALTYTVPIVTDLSLTERLVKLGDGTIENVVDVWFNRPVFDNNTIRKYKNAKIYFSTDDGDSWVNMGVTSGDSYSIVGNMEDLEAYKIAVVSSSEVGVDNPISISPQASITLIGKTALPEDVTGFLVNQSRDRLYFGWTNVSDVDLDSYEIRYGASWDAGYAIASRIKSNRYIAIDFRTGADQSFWIKAIDTSGNFSETATEAVITIDSIPFQNIIESYQEQTAWTGDKVNTEVSGDDLIISTGELTGTYTTPVRDIGYLATFKVGIEEIITVVDDATLQDFGELTLADMPETYRLSGAELGDAATFEIKISEDNSTWSDWLPWQPADYYCRYIQIKMTITRANTSQALVCSQLNTYADLPDVDDKLEGEVTVAADGLDIIFNKEYHKIYAVSVTIITGTGVYPKITSLDLTGCNVKLYDSSGTVQTGEFLCHIHGV